MPAQCFANPLNVGSLKAIIDLFAENVLNLPVPLAPVRMTPDRKRFEEVRNTFDEG